MGIWIWCTWSWVLDEGGQWMTFRRDLDSIGRGPEPKITADYMATDVPAQRVLTTSWDYQNSASQLPYWTVFRRSHSISVTKRGKLSPYAPLGQVVQCRLLQTHYWSNFYVPACRLCFRKDCNLSEFFHRSDLSTLRVLWYIYLLAPRCLGSQISQMVFIRVTPSWTPCGAICFEQCALGELEATGSQNFPSY